MYLRQVLLIVLRIQVVAYHPYNAGEEGFVHNIGKHRRTYDDQAAAGELGSCVGLLLSGRLLRYKVLPFLRSVNLISGGYQCRATFFKSHST
jgi:hypothetical protein